MSVFTDLARYFIELAPQIRSFEYTIGYLIARIEDAVNHSYLFDALVSGGQGTGKSTIALYTMYKHYGDPSKVLENVFFKVEDLRQTLLEEKREVVLLDDAGITLSKYRFMTQEAVDYVLLQQIARTRVSAIIYTTVYDNIIKHLRDIVDTVIALHTRRGRVVYGSLYSKRTKYHTVVKRLFDFTIDFTEVHKNEEFHSLYEEYNRRRETFIKSVIEELSSKRIQPPPRKTREEIEIEEAERFFNHKFNIGAYVKSG